MDLQTANQLVEILLKAGASGALLWVLIGGHYKLWVYGRELTQLRADTDARLQDAEKRIAEAQHQVYWWQQWESKQRETIDRALVVGEKLAAALQRASERSRPPGDT